MGTLSLNDRNALIKTLIDKMSIVTLNPNKLQSVLREAGLNQVLLFVNFNQDPYDVIVSVVDHLDSRGRDKSGLHVLGKFLNTLKVSEFVPIDQEAIPFIDEILQRYNLLGPSTIPSVRISSEEDRRIDEVIIGENTLRPIGFLMLGLHVSSSICRIGLRGGGSGTGFLISDNLIITNNHVIPSSDVLEDCIFTFNYQTDINGELQQGEKIKPNVNGIFHTSPRSELDYTVVELKASDNGESPGAKWGWLKLSKAEVNVNDRVNIIQHPGGEPKHISIQNNFVQYVDDKIVQYLAATLKGSSGSPVFNNDWRVVALHHVGGEIIEPKSRKTYYRNEGIKITSILKDLPADILNKLNKGTS